MVNYRYDKAWLSGKAKQSVYSYSHFWGEIRKLVEGPAKQLPLISSANTKY